jgi:hypothetical protein
MESNILFPCHHREYSQKIINSIIIDRSITKGASGAIGLSNLPPIGHHLIKNRVEFLPVTQEVLLVASQLWADARRQGQPTADDQSLEPI